jgi:hypothetical protein
MNHNESCETVYFEENESFHTCHSPQNSVLDANTDETATTRTSIENKTLIGLAVVIMLVPILVSWTLLMIFFLVVIQPPNDRDRKPARRENKVSAHDKFIRDVHDMDVNNKGPYRW